MSSINWNFFFTNPGTADISRVYVTAHRWNIELYGVLTQYDTPNLCMRDGRSFIGWAGDGINEGK